MGALNVAPVDGAVMETTGGLLSPVPPTVIATGADAALAPLSSRATAVS
jgi:hypothetical protein